MNRGPLIFIGVLSAVVLSFLVMIFLPQTQIGGLQAEAIPPMNEIYPNRRPGLAEQGEAVYRANGCYYCHTQQARPEGYGADFERGWGLRQNVARDYLYDDPVMLGAVRMGPDLANIGVRQPDEFWHLLHLYDPKLTVPRSMMPKYPYLFEKRKIGVRPSPNALPLPEGTVEEGYEVVPTQEARALVAYMRSLRANNALTEMPLPEEAQPEAEEGADTNAPPVLGDETNAVTPATGDQN